MREHTTNTKQCSHCGKEFAFYPSRPDRLYCSRACYLSAHAAPLTTFTCRTCGKTFQIKESYKGRYTFCSDICRELDKQPKLCGVYMIKCFPTNMMYIGSSTNILRRWRGHRSKLKSGTHENPNLQREYNTYGLDNFTYTVLGNTDKANLYMAEQLVLNTINPNQLYNVHPQADSASGRKLTPEQRADVSRRNKGRTITEEHRRKLSEALKGRQFSDEHRRNLSEAKRKKPSS